MEENLCNQQRNTAEHSNDDECLKGDYQPIAQNSSMVRHVRTKDGNSACNEPEISDQIEPEVGYFYEIDHTKLPPRSPIQLKSIRIVMVTEKTEHNVSVKFPSNHSLRKFFNPDSSNGSSQDLAAKVQPALDEQFVMGLRLARIALTRLVPSSELLKQKKSQSFWLLPLKTTENVDCVAKEDLENDDPMVKGTCWSALKCTGQMHWGVRRRVTFIGRHKEKTPQPFFASIREGKEEEKEDEEEQEEDAKETKTEETEKTTRKRKRESSSRIQKTKSARKREREKLSGCNSKREKPQSGSKDRWSSERYKLAEQNLLEIMKEKGAVVGHPILRPQLRQEARKHIGDTGLLDHLLKHMAGKVAPGGTERFRRRHNPDGAMEYWLESADLVNIRKEAGVDDPYWFPPPGWEPGDNPSQHPLCTSELKLLKEEVATLKREVQELLKKQQQDEGLEAAADGATNVNEETNAASRSLAINHPQSELANKATRQEIYEHLASRKAQLEQQLVEFSKLLKEMQEELGKVSPLSTEEQTVIIGAEEEEKEKGAKWMESAAADTEKTDAADIEQGRVEKAAEAGRAEKKQRLRSGFRICKPQGTFLWPNMVGSGCSNILSPPNAAHAPHSQVVIQVEDLLMVPTPPSVSSAPRLPINLDAPAPPPPPHPLLLPPTDHPTTPTSNMIHPQPSPSPVRPMAEKRALTVSSVVVGRPESICCQGDNISTATVPPRLNLDLNDVSYAAAEENEDSVVRCDEYVAVVDSGSTTMEKGGDHPISQHYHRQQKQKQQQQESCSSSVGTWLALSPPNPYLDGPNRG